MSRYWPGIGHGSSRSMCLHRRQESIRERNPMPTCTDTRRPSQHRNGHSSVEGELPGSDRLSPLPARWERGWGEGRPTNYEQVPLLKRNMSGPCSTCLAERSTGACLACKRTAQSVHGCSACAGRATRSSGAVHVAPPVRQGHTGRSVPGTDPPVLQTPVQHGSGVPAPQAVPCPMQEPGTRQAPSIQVPVQQLRLAQLSPMLAHWAGRQTPSPHHSEQHCASRGAGQRVGKAAAAKAFALALVVAGMLPDVLPGRLPPNLEGLAARRLLVRTVTDLPLFLGRARLRGKRHPGERGDTRDQPPQSCRSGQRRGREPLDQYIEPGTVHVVTVPPR